MLPLATSLSSLLSATTIYREGEESVCEREVIERERERERDRRNIAAPKSAAIHILLSKSALALVLNVAFSDYLTRSSKHSFSRSTVAMSYY